MAKEKEEIKVRFEGEVAGNKSKTNVFTRMLKGIVKGNKGKVEVQQHKAGEDEYGDM